MPAPSLSFEREITEGNLIVPITIDPESFAMKQTNRLAEVSTTLPAWLKAKAEAEHLDFSKVLESALLELLEDEGQKFPM